MCFDKGMKQRRLSYTTSEGVSIFPNHWGKKLALSNEVKL